MSYAVFDGEELLQRSLESMRAHVNYINIVYSPESYYGDLGNPELPAMLEALKCEGLIDEIVMFRIDNPAPKGDRDAKQLLHRAKRNRGLSAASSAGCDYFMSMDTDEFYDAAAVEKAKAKIVGQGITHSFAHILNYGRLPTQLSNSRKWEYYVPFFSRLTPSSRLGENACAPCHCDHARLSSHYKDAKYYVLDDIFMHHYTRVRRNLAAKYATRQVTDAVDADWLDKEDGFIEVPDYFNLGGILKR